jgi:hypothetical protein
MTLSPRILEPDRALEGPPNVEVALGASQIGLSDD